MFPVVRHPALGVVDGEIGKSGLSAQRQRLLVNVLDFVRVQAVGDDEFGFGAHHLAP